MGAKVLGKQVLINACNIVFFSHNNDGHVTFFMQNGFEMSINIFFSEAEQILNSAMHLNITLINLKKVILCNQ